MAGLISGSVAGRLRVQEFRTSGTFNVPSGVKAVSLFLVGGGGSTPVNTYSLGQGGNVVELNYDVSGKVSCNVVVGAGGTGGGDGGDTTFDGVAVAKGGKAGGIYNSGNAPTKNINATAGKNGFGGHGSSSEFGSIPVNGALGATNTSQSGPANTGAGASGGNASGGSGYARVEWYE